MTGSRWRAGRSATHAAGLATTSLMEATLWPPSGSRAGVGTTA
jgi:hypothetical protein